MVHSIFCDHLNALGDNQLHSAWKLHASACMNTSIPVRQLIVTCYSSGHKNFVSQGSLENLYVVNDDSSSLLQLMQRAVNWLHGCQLLEPHCIQVVSKICKWACSLEKLDDHCLIVILVDCNFGWKKVCNEISLQQKVLKSATSSERPLFHFIFFAG